MTTMARRNWRAATALVALMTVGATLGVPSAGADPGGPLVESVEELPAGVRYEPRRAAILAGSSAGIVIDREQDTRWMHIGDVERVLVRPDGSETVLTDDVDLVGDRFVMRRTATGGVWTRRIDDVQWQAVDPGPDHTVIAWTLDGALIAPHPWSAPDSEAPALVLRPWTGGPDVVIHGLDGHQFPSHQTAYAGDEHGAVVSAFRPRPSGNVSTTVYVDTGRTSAHDLGVTSGIWGMNAEALAFVRGDAPGGPDLGVLARPTADQATVDPAYRPFPQPGASWWRSAVLPHGDDVLVWREGDPFAGHRADDIPLRAIDPAGVSRVVLPWAQSVRGTDDGRVLAVTHEGDGPNTVIEIDPTSGRRTQVLPLAPMPAIVTQIGLVGDEAWWTTTAGRDQRLLRGAPSDPITVTDGIGDPVCRSDECVFAVGDGAIRAWSEGDIGQNRWVWLGPDGTRREGRASGLVRSVHGSLLHVGSDIIDTRDGSVVRQAPGDSDSGVEVLTSSADQTWPRDRVAVRSFEPGRAAAFLQVPGCVEPGAPQSVGAWLLARCLESSDAWSAWDRVTGEVVEVSSLHRIRLGNGFVVRATRDGLDARPLVSGAEWTPITAEVTTDPGAFTVSTSGPPRVAWHVDGRAWVATLRVQPAAPAPVLTGGPALPTPPSLRVDAGDSRLVARWGTAPVNEQLTGYLFQVQSSPAVLLGPEVTSRTLERLTNNTHRRITLHAVNIWGRATSTAGGTPQPAPAAPTDVRASVDPVTSRGEVRWSWSPTTGTQELTGFAVEVGGVRSKVGPDARSHPIASAVPTDTSVSVIALGSDDFGGQPASVRVVFPGADRVAPTARVTGLAAATTSARATLRVAAADDRALGAVELQRRTTTRNGKDGPWQGSAAWRSLAPGPVSLTGLRPGTTTCVRARARDRAGNVSPWTRPSCTSRALPATALVRVGGWQAVRGPGHLGGRALRSRTRGSELVVTDAKARGASVLALTCPTCGSLSVWTGATGWGTVNLRSATPRVRMVRLPWAGQQLKGPNLRLRVVRNGGPVEISGVVLRHHH